MRILATAIGLAVASGASGQIAALSDEFEDAATLGEWQRHHVEQGWPDQAAVLDIDTTSAGCLYIEPEVSSWYQDYRGMLLAKEVSGDFVVTTRIRARGLDGGLPSSDYSLAGLMVRAPREPGPWATGEENWLFITTGRGNDPGQYQIERKTTIDSDSQLVLAPGAEGWVELAIRRTGGSFGLWYRFEGADWVLHWTYERPDMPDVVQVGIGAYSDWPSVEAIPGGAAAFNPLLVSSPPGNRDLAVEVDYVRYAAPRVVQRRDLR